MNERERVLGGAVLVVHGRGWRGEVVRGDHAGALGRI